MEDPQLILQHWSFWEECLQVQEQCLLLWKLQMAAEILTVILFSNMKHRPMRLIMRGHNSEVLRSAKHGKRSNVIVTRVQAL